MERMRKVIRIHPEIVFEKTVKIGVPEFVWALLVCGLMGAIFGYALGQAQP